MLYARSRVSYDAEVILGVERRSVKNSEIDYYDREQQKLIHKTRFLWYRLLVPSYDDFVCLLAQ